MTPQLPAPGWYRDPTEQSEGRYWNGAAWTEMCRPPTRRLVKMRRLLKMRRRRTTPPMADAGRSDCTA